MEEEKKSQPSNLSLGSGSDKNDQKDSSKDQITNEDFEKLVEESFHQRKIEEGEIIKGRIVSISSEYAMVDIGDKCEGQVPIEQLKIAGKLAHKEGDEIEVVIEGRQEENGIILLSKERADKRRLWEELEQAYKTATPVKGKIVEKIKGGFNVDVGMIAFMPNSQASIKPLKNPEELVNTEDYFKILKFNRGRSNLVVSRRAVQEDEQDRMKRETLSKIREGVIIKAKVKNMTEYGVFLDLGGVDGLLHITDISYKRIGHPSEVLKVGDEIEVKVLKYDRDKQRISLGLKQLQPDPWETVDKKYPVGTIVQGKVVSIMDYGVFVELEPGVEGLVHVSEMSWNKKRVHPSKLVKEGDKVEAKVLEIDIKNRKLSLGMKQVMPNPWEVLASQYPPGTIVKGKIKNLTNFGIFVGVQEGVDGLVHISDISWTKRLKHPSELFKKGDEVECVVLNVDPVQERFSLGIKQLKPDPWDLVGQKYRPGSKVSGKVVNITDFGVFIEIEEGVEGLVHISELSEEKVDDPHKLVQLGQELKAEVMSLDVQERKIRLSVKALAQAEEKELAEDYKASVWDGTSKLGEIIQKKLYEAKEDKKQEREKNNKRGQD